VLRSYCYHAPVNCTPNACGSFACDTTTGSCSIYTPTANCNDALVCTKDSCNTTTGCVNAPLTGTDLTSVCPGAKSCQSTSCPATGSACFYTNITTGSCGCRNAGCLTSGDACNLATCLTTTASCPSGSANAACVSAVNNVTLGYYCSVTPITCAHSPCQNVTCNATLAPNQCVYTAYTGCDDSNQCTGDQCLADACVFTPLTPAQQVSVCDDGIACTTDSCAAPSTSCQHDIAPCNAAACVSSPCAPQQCSVSTCINSVAACPAGTNNAACVAAVQNPLVARYCAYAPLVCNGDSCGPTQCDGGSPGTCARLAPINCTDGDICTQDACVGGAGPTNLGGQCQFTKLPDSSVCTGAGLCQSAVCASNACSYPAVTTGSCGCSLCPAAANCTTAKCYFQGSSTACDVSSNPAQCNSAVGNASVGYYCDQAPVVCPVSNCVTSTCNVATNQCVNGTTACPFDACSNFSCNITTGSCSIYTFTGSCSDGLACTKDSCNIITGCVHSPVSGTDLTAVCPNKSCQTATCPATGSACFYSNVTTGSCGCRNSGCLSSGDACNLATCVTTTASCPPGSNNGACMSAVNNVTQGYYCSVTPIICAHSPCQNVTCNATLAPNQCVYTAYTGCDDGNQCTTDACAADVCVFTPLTPAQQATLCDDGIGCTNDTCAAPSTTCQHDSTPCSNLACVNSPCPAHACSVSNCINNVADCPAANNSGCQADVQNALVGRYCDYTPLVCNGDACGPTQCDGGSPGTCARFAAINCTDGDMCTQDSCVGGTGPTHLGGQCQFTKLPDSSVCTGAGLCRSAVCASNACSYPAVTTGSCGCSLCPAASNCTTATCYYQGSAAACDESSDPTQCNSALGNAAVGYFCDQEPVECPTSNCVTSTCDVSTNQCVNGTTACPFDACSSFTCDVATGLCSVYTYTASCDDGLACSKDDCDGVTGCTHVPVTGADLTAVCPDAKACQTTSCPVTGSACFYTDITTGSCGCRNSGCLSSGDACNLATCVTAVGSCPAGSNNAACVAAVNNLTRGYYCNVAPITCAHSPCQNVACNAALAPNQCVYTAYTGCNDNNQCTGDACVADACVFTPLTPAQQASVCDDGISCTTDSCAAPSTSCQHDIAPCNAAACVSSPCAAQQCSVSTCISSTASCPPGTKNAACVAAVLNPLVGRYCSYTPLVCGGDACGPTQCDGGSPGTCARLAPINCTDGDMCTQDACVGGTGAAHLGGQCQFTKLPDSSVCTESFTCQVGTCSNNACTYGQLNVGECGCATCPLAQPCTVQQCVFTGSVGTCASTGDPASCDAAVANASVGFYCDQQPVVCPPQQCKVCTCSAFSNQCSCGPLVCDDNDKCTYNECGATGCSFPPVSPAVVDTLCPKPGNDPCQVASCSNNTCSFSMVTTGACALSPCAASPCPTPADACQLPACADSTSACSSTFGGNASALAVCLQTLGSQSRYCGSVTRSCPPSTVCQKNWCDGLVNGTNSGACLSSLTDCSGPNQCILGSCNVQSGGCVSTPYNCSFSNKCLTGTCVDTGIANCSVTGTRVCDDGLVCTTDTCDPFLGCVYTPVACSVSGGATGCNASIGCFEPGNAYNLEQGCHEQLITSLVDFCGICKGDNVGCFFSSLVSAGVIASISAGAAVGIAFGEKMSRFVMFSSYFS
jgi:hypothetical protein